MEIDFNSHIRSEYLHFLLNGFIKLTHFQISPDEAFENNGAQSGLNLLFGNDINLFYIIMLVLMCIHYARFFTFAFIFDKVLFFFDTVL